MKTLQSFNLHTAFLQNATEINGELLRGLDENINEESTRKSHFFNGRYENIYIDAQHIPALNQVLNTCLACSADILHIPAGQLKAGLWFNQMKPGDRTTLHRHDDDDELLSAVYYVSVAENSGELLIGKGPVMTHVTPQAGMFVFFPPNMPHEVTENRSQHTRVSLGINIGPRHTEG